MVILEIQPNETKETTDPHVQISPLPAGAYRFELVVEDQAGNRSKVADLQIFVQRR